jgi:hypothetical protein
MSITDPTAKAAAVAALALAMSIGLATAPAQAVPYLNVTCNLTYHPVDGTNFDVYLLDVQGVVTMSQAAAQDSINHGHTIQLRYWGDDLSDDDLLYGPIAAPNVFAAADGVHYQYNVNFSRSQLDEDTPIIVDPDDTDEIYVGARFLDPSGKTLSLVESNRIKNEF